MKMIKNILNRKDGNKDSITIGINAIQCNKCEKWYKGVEIYEIFNQGVKHSLLFKYDRNNETFLINENTLMHAIQLVNPMQKQRKLKLISQKEWLDFKNI